IGPLYPLELTPASLEKVDEPVSVAGLLGAYRSARRREGSAFDRGLICGAIGLGLELVVLRLLVGLPGQLGPAERHLRLGELGVGRGVGDRRGCGLVALGAGGADGGGTPRATFLGAFAVTGHGELRSASARL